MMPYIEPRQRELFEKSLNNLINLVCCKGDMTYIVTRLIHLYITRHIQMKNYEALSQGKSILADALDEFNNAVMNPYENKKRRENGPISTLDEVDLEDVR